MSVVTDPLNESATEKGPLGAIAVIGGGVVGVCCALYLQRSGYTVTLIDPAKAGESTGKWSCGQLAIGEVVPLSKPGILKKIPGWLVDQEGPLALRPLALPRMLPWMMRFLACARRSKLVEISRDLASLTGRVFEDYEPLLGECAGEPLLSERPVMQVFDSAAGLEDDLRHADLPRSLGFSFEKLGADEIGDLEPTLAGKFSYGILLSDWRFVTDTERFIVALTESFLSLGGRRLQAGANRINEDNGRATGVLLSTGESVAADQIVVAAGVGSQKFFRQLGVNIPLEGVAGYQVLLTDPGIALRHSVIYADGGFCLAPMTRGLQVGGTIEFAQRDAAPNFRRAQIILDKTRRIFPDLRIEKKELGVGYRPLLPDTKPVIDRTRNLPNVILATGHGQLGLTLAATTGRVVTDLVSGRTPPVDLAPFSAYRF
ncbi:NAD(P)/FAD-dependent oxidoreductase [Paraburkholderia phenoliruptrix]|uniref:D-amino-acid dehydrogenase n=2 Tax=Paraburkholderia phenoliruptrix TaxID=252970 RepID=K0E1K8_9BURK|nr:FAD-dependent oxidoreductase [Paraburkholderia phenoliruptrix]AFT90298.1 D-amino-acid dehydrogenase [Paraburkholderia phenoliruptrix BR3459a]CAB4051717.1 D-amino acid dehydrogenase 1 [Paraburkholderia phenoliruptrix]